MSTAPQALSVVILAAGKGTRMRSERPKVLHAVCGQSLLERAVRAAAALQPIEILVVIGFGAEAVRAELARIQATLPTIALREVLQQSQLGTGDAARQALPHIDPRASQVVILPGDAPLLTSDTLTEVAASFRGGVLFLSCLLPEPSGFGRVVRDTQGQVQAIVEQRDCTAEQREIQEINGGVYYTDAEQLRALLPLLTNTNAQQEYYLTDIVQHARAKGIAVEATIVQEAMQLAGANTRAELSELERYRRLAINRRHMEAGVTLEDPYTTYIDEAVVIEADTYIGAGTRLKGQTSVGAEVTIEGDSFVINSVIAAHTRVRLGCYIDSAVVGADCRIGPFAQLRPGTRLGTGVHLGNFVETKAATLADGVKANHLTYLGDVTVGENTNVGAGTITCNYDGVTKSRTEIGAESFIGSNSALVAPVTVGNRAYIGAGSVVTTDVPDDALGVARARQRNIEGWKSRKKS